MEDITNKIMLPCDEMCEMCGEELQEGQPAYIDEGLVVCPACLNNEEHYGEED